MRFSGKNNPYFRWIVAGLLIFFLAVQISCSPEYHTVQFSSVQELQEYLQYAPEKKPLVGAHRGGPMPGYPENAIETFQHSLEYAPCLIECDVRKTADGHLVMMHDETLDRTTTGKGRVSDFTLAELKELRLKDTNGRLTHFRIPTFEEVLRWAVGRAILEIDVKKGVTPQEILQHVLKSGALPYVVVITYNLEQLRTYAALHPDLMISASAHTVEGVNRILATGVNPRRLLVFVGVTEPERDVYRLLHRHGIRAILGTMHNIDHAAEKRGVRVYLKVLENGADVLATDNVPLAAQAIELFWKKSVRNNSACIKLL